MDSIREALTAAVAKAEEKDPDALKSAATIGTDEPGDAAPIGDELDTNVDSTQGDEADSTGKDIAATSTTDAVAQAPVEVPVAAPASWNSAEKAEWAALSPNAKKAVLRREGEIQRSFQANATNRRRVEAIDRATEQYKPLLAKYGVTIEQVMPPLLATRAALEVGTDEQKATLVANICADFGIPVDALIDAWNTRFADGAAPPQRVQPPVQAPLDPRVENLINMIEEGKTERARQALAPIESLPNYDAVRFTMADLIEKAHDVGQQLPLDKAHTLACQLHGFEVAASAPTVTASQAASILAKSRNAASSVAGAPKPTPPRKPGEGSVHDEITALMSARK